jgi:hypothetical protein
MDDVIAEARATSSAGIAIKLRVAMPDLDLGNTGGRLVASTLADLERLAGQSSQPTT